jgi:hypothetical protein
MAEQVLTQKRFTKGKIYSLHAPEVECIAKGKAHRPYEFGVKVSVAVTHKEGFVVGIQAFTSPTIPTTATPWMCPRAGPAASMPA